MQKSKLCLYGFLTGLFLCFSNLSYAQTWADIGTVGTLNANELCYTDGTDIICDAGLTVNAPSATLIVPGTLSATAFVGDGASLTNVTATVGINDLLDAIHDTDDYSSLFLGYGAGVNDDGTDNRNLGVGLNALNAATSGTGNLAVGRGALANITTASSNTVIGFEAGNASLSGNRNILIGSGVNTVANTNSDQLNIGNVIMIDMNGDTGLSPAPSYLGDGAVALGPNAEARFGGNVAIGDGSRARSSNSIAIGADSEATNNFTTAVGGDSDAKSVGSSAFGYSANAGSRGFAAGYNANSGTDGTAVGYSARVTGSSSAAIAIGHNAAISNASEDSIAIGVDSVINGANHSIAMGTNSTVTSNNSGLINLSGSAYTLATSNTFEIVGATVSATAFVGDGASLTNVGGGASSINDLTDAIHDTDDFSSLYLGNGAGASDDGTDNRNVGIGVDALNANTSGNNNIAVGEDSLKSNTTGSNNIAIGSDALTDTTSGSDNVGIGENALRYQTTASYNTAIGAYAMTYTRTGQRNTVMGREAGKGAFFNADFDDNVLLGYRAGYLLENNADDNVIIGASAGDVLTTGTDNILIGYSVNATSNTSSNQLNIGNTIYGDLANDYIGIGVESPNVELDVSGSIEYTGTLSDVSDRRLKQNIQSLDDGALAKIEQINTVSFEMKDNPSVTEFGVIAQDFEKIYPELVNTADDDMGTKSVNYVGLIAPMVKAMQEQQQQIKALQQELKELKEAN